MTLKLQSTLINVIDTKQEINLHVSILISDSHKITSGIQLKLIRRPTLKYNHVEGISKTKSSVISLCAFDISIRHTHLRATYIYETMISNAIFHFYK